VTRHLLSIITLVPLAGALLLAAVGRDRDRLLHTIARVTTAIVFAASSRLALGFEPRGPEWQFTERFELLPSIGASYAVGVDGLGMLLILLTAFLTFIAVLASWARVEKRLKAFYIAVLALEAGMLGVYMALDLLFFCLCWMLAATAMCLLVGWVGQGAPGAATDHGRSGTRPCRGCGQGPEPPYFATVFVPADFLTLPRSAAYTAVWRTFSPRSPFLPS